MFGKGRVNGTQRKEEQNMNVGEGSWSMKLSGKLKIRRGMLIEGVEGEVESRERKGSEGESLSPENIHVFDRHDSVQRRSQLVIRILYAVEAEAKYAVSKNIKREPSQVKLNLCLLIRFPSGSQSVTEVGGAMSDQIVHCFGVQPNTYILTQLIPISTRLLPYSTINDLQIWQKGWHILTQVV